ncbi:hypothetical protein ABK040_011212 [Willaertia magna]
MNFRIDLVANSKLEEKVNSFLKKRESYCSLLVGNLIQYGPLQQSNQLYSADYYIIKSNSTTDINKIIEMVFCYTVGGKLLFQKRNNLLDKELLSEMLMFVIEKYKFIKEILGEYNLSKFMVEKLIENKIWKEDGMVLSEKQNLYKKSLINFHYDQSTLQNNLILTKVTNINDYYPLLILFENEQNLQNNSNTTTVTPFETIKENFNNLTIYGLYLKENNKLISMCKLNNKTKNIGTVGGVFTLKEYRRKGFSQCCLNFMFSELKKEDLKELILFTEESNSANYLYLKLGFEYVGDLGIFSCSL